ncbi:MAG: IS21 family transposase [Spirochaetota bacterium]|nr:IS21 family transposase [Spirochaetota bacterium]
MPRKRIQMSKIREIVRLHKDCNLSQRQVAEVSKVSRPKVSKILSILEETGLNYSKIKTFSDSDLETVFTVKTDKKSKADLLREKFPDFAKELKKPGVNLTVLWNEYIEENPDGLRSSQFSHHFRQWRKDEKLSMHINHKAGDKMFIDYAGKRMEITDRESGEKSRVEIFVTILPASQLTYVEAAFSQKQEDFMRSTERAIRYYGGVPSALVPDNLKSGVIKANFYEPEINILYSDFAEYYRTAVVPARALKPKDKAHVENAVKIIYSRIFAPLRNKTFYSIEELNKAIWSKLEDHNNRELSKMTVSRRELFEEIEKNKLKMLPVYPYPLKHFQDGKAAFNYHVELKEDKHYYSVPYLLRGKTVRLIYDERNVAIYHDNIRIVQHRRNKQAHKYTTQKGLHSTDLQMTGILKKLKW